MKRLDKMSAIVTGGGRGIGKAIALGLASEGCDVVICSKNMKELEKTAREIEKIGARCLPVHVDVTKKGNVINAVSQTMRTFKRIDLLVNNARLDIVKPIENMTQKEWTKVLDTNLGGMFLFTQAVVSHMLNQDSGIIINIASETKTFPGMTAFCATKFGAIGFTESLAKELEDDDIKVFAICPQGLDADVYHSTGLRHPPAYSSKAIAEKVLYLVINSKKIKTGSSIDV